MDAEVCRCVVLVDLNDPKTKDARAHVSAKHCFASIS
jgi:hypothetical protein